VVAPRNPIRAGLDQLCRLVNAFDATVRPSVDKQTLAAATRKDSTNVPMFQVPPGRAVRQGDRLRNGKGLLAAIANAT
jgi:hypothetical protein